jgi:hypothetical protein
VIAGNWQLRVRYFLRRIGVPGWLGTLCLVAALAFLSVQVLPAFDHLATLERRQAAAQAKLAQQAGGPGAILTPAQQLAAFYGDFPQGAKIPDVLARIHDIAEEQKLALELGEYALSKAQGGRLDQFRITLPVKGPYPQVRKFAAEALAELPALSLESLSLRREKVAEGAVEGRIVFLLFVEHDS